MGGMTTRTRRSAAATPLDGGPSADLLTRTGFDPSPAQIVGRGDKILVAAYQQLSECGLEGLTVAVVLKRAGQNRRSFYERFSGKDDLVLEVFRQALRSVAEECREAAEKLRDPVEILRFMVRHLIVAEASFPARKIGPALAREHMRLAAAKPDELRAALQPLLTVFAEQLAAGMACGKIREAAPEQLAAFMYNLAATTAHGAILSGERDESAQSNRAQLADEVWEFCRRAITA